MLFINDPAECFVPSGSEFKFNILTVMMDKQWQIHLINSRSTSYEKLVCDYFVHTVPLIGSVNSILSRVFYLLESLFAAVNLTKKYNINIITCHAGHLTNGVVAYLASRITRRKCLIRVNEDNVTEFRLFVEKTQNKIFGNKILIKVIMFCLIKIERNLFKHVDWIVTQGPADYLKIRKITNKITFLPLWVDAKNFKPLPRNQIYKLRAEVVKDANKKVILYVGRFVPEKDIETLFRAFKILTTFRKNVVLLMVGTGQRGQYYRNYAKSLGINNKVRFEGFILHEKLPPYYNLADIYVMPSFSEELSNTVLEALACGVPVIATDISSNLYLVKDEENGFIFPVRNHIALAEKVLYVLDLCGKFPDKITKISANARKSIQRYTEESMGEAYKQVIIKLISH